MQVILMLISVLYCKQDSIFFHLESENARLNITSRTFGVAFSFNAQTVSAPKDVELIGSFPL
jgi:hypothetical protein